MSHLFVHHGFFFSKGSPLMFHLFWHVFLSKGITFGMAVFIIEWISYIFFVAKFTCDLLYISCMLPRTLLKQWYFSMWCNDDKFLLCTIYLSQVVDCRACGGSFIAGGLSKPSSKRERFSSTDVASVMKSKAPLAAAKAVVAGSPTLAGLAMPKERNSTPNNRCSTP